MPGSRNLLTLLSDLLKVVCAIPIVEYQRLTCSLHDAVTLARRSGSGVKTRNRLDRQDLRRSIAAIDRFVPGGPNCVRRALLEIRLDGAAAKESLFAGFKSGGGPKSGHAWLESDPRAAPGSFDATTVI